LPLGVEAPCADYGHLPAAERARICGAVIRRFLTGRANVLSRRP